MVFFAFNNSNSEAPMIKCQLAFHELCFNMFIMERFRDALHSVIKSDSVSCEYLAIRNEIQCSMDRPLRESEKLVLQDMLLRASRTTIVTCGHFRMMRLKTEMTTVLRGIGARNYHRKYRCTENIDGN